MRSSASLKQQLKRNLAIGLIGMSALGFGVLLGHTLAGKVLDYQARKSAPQTGSITQQITTNFNLDNLDEQIAGQLKEYIDILQGLPEMESVFANLPSHLHFEVSDDTPGIASYSMDEDSICLTPELAKSPARDVVKTLAHELCHANQKSDGLYYSSNKNLSFADTFRIAKLMETETKLRGVLIERALRREGLFVDEPKTEACEVFDAWVDELGEQGARDKFVKACWQGNMDVDLSPDIEEMFMSHYLFYNFQGFHHAQLMHNPNFAALLLPPTGHLSAQEVADQYAQRMKVSFGGDFFLTNQDNAEVHEEDRTVDFLFSDGTRNCLALDENNLLLDHLTSYDAAGNYLGERLFYKGELVPEGVQSVFARTSSVSEDQAMVRAEKMAGIDLLVGAEFDMDLQQMSDLIEQHPASVNYQGILKDTPIMRAVQSGRDDVVQLLMSKNANLLLADERDRTVLNYLDDYGDQLQPETQKIIRQGYVLQEKALSEKGRVL